MSLIDDGANSQINRSPKKEQTPYHLLNQLVPAFTPAVDRHCTNVKRYITPSMVKYAITVQSIRNSAPQGRDPIFLRRHILRHHSFRQRRTRIQLLETSWSRRNFRSANRGNQTTGIAQSARLTYTDCRALKEGTDVLVKDDNGLLGLGRVLSNNKSRVKFEMVDRLSWEKLEEKEVVTVSTRNGTHRVWLSRTISDKDEEALSGELFIAAKNASCIYEPGKLDIKTLARLAHKHNFRYGLIERWMRAHKKDTVTAASSPPVVESEIPNAKSKYISAKRSPRRQKRAVALDLDDIFNPRRKRSYSGEQKTSITPPRVEIPFTPAPTTFFGGSETLPWVNSWNSLHEENPLDFRDDYLVPSNPVAEFSTYEKTRVKDIREKTKSSSSNFEISSQKKKESRSIARKERGRKRKREEKEVKKDDESKFCSLPMRPVKSSRRTEKKRTRTPKRKRSPNVLGLTSFIDDWILKPVSNSPAWDLKSEKDNCVREMSTNFKMDREFGNTNTAIGPKRINTPEPSFPFDCSVIFSPESQLSIKPRVKVELNGESRKSKRKKRRPKKSKNTIVSVSPRAAVMKTESCVASVPKSSLVDTSNPSELDSNLKSNSEASCLVGISSKNSTMDNNIKLKVEAEKCASFSIPSLELPSHFQPIKVEPILSNASIIVKPALQLQDPKIEPKLEPSRAESCVMLMQAETKGYARCNQKPKRLRKAPDTYVSEFYGPKVNSTNCSKAKFPTWNALDLPLEFNKHFASWCQKLILKIWRHEHAWVFHEPVNWRVLNIPTYPERVKEPMDLGTILKKVKELRYRFLDDFFYDIGLVFSNAWLFNKETDDVHIMASVLYQEYVYWKYRMWDELQRLKRRARKRNPPVDRTPIIVRLSRKPTFHSKYIAIPWGQRPRPMYREFKCKYMLVKKVSQFTIKIRRRCFLYESGSITTLASTDTSRTCVGVLQKSPVELKSRLVAASTAMSKEVVAKESYPENVWKKRKWSKPGHSFQGTLRNWMRSKGENPNRYSSEATKVEKAPSSNRSHYSDDLAKNREIPTASKATSQKPLQFYQDTTSISDQNRPNRKKLKLDPPQVSIYPSDTDSEKSLSYKDSSLKRVYSACPPLQSNKGAKITHGRKRFKLSTKKGVRKKVKPSENNSSNVDTKKRNSKAQTPTPTQSRVSRKSAPLRTIKSFFPTLTPDVCNVQKRLHKDHQVDLKSKLIATNQASTPLPTQNPNLQERLVSPELDTPKISPLLELKRRVVAHWMNLCSNGKTRLVKLLYTFYTQEYGALSTNSTGDHDQKLDWEFLMKNKKYKLWLKNFLNRCFDERLQQYRECQLKYLSLIQSQGSDERTASSIPNGAAMMPLPPPEELFSRFRPNGSLISLSAAQYSKFYWGCWQLPPVLSHSLEQSGR